MFPLAAPDSHADSLGTYEAGYGERTACLRSGSCEVVFLYEERDFGSFRYRCYAMARALNRTRPGSATWIFQREIAVLEGALGGIRTLVLARMPWTNALERLLVRAEAAGIDLVYDVDDLVFDPSWSPAICNLVRTKNRIEVDYWFGYVARRFAVAERCHRYLATHEFLAERVRRCFPGRKVGVVPNVPTPEEFSESERIRGQKAAVRSASPFLVGYFSGSMTHNDDFGMIEGDLLAFLDRHGEVVLRLGGYLELSSQWNRIRDEGRIQTMGLTDFLGLQWRIAECDLNLAPLVPGVFADCKTELKFFDAALVDVPTLASPTYAFREAIEDGENGVLAGATAWLDALEELLGAGGEGRRAMAERARRDVLAGYRGERVDRRIAKAFFGEEGDV